MHTSSLHAQVDNPLTEGAGSYLVGAARPRDGERCKPLPVMDLTVAGESNYMHLPPIKRFWRTRSVRRTEVDLAEMDGMGKPVQTEDLTRFLLRDNQHSYEAKFKYITGTKNYFQRFVRKFPVAALCVWVFFFFLEVALVAIDIIQSTHSYNVTWVRYDVDEHSAWFYARSVLVFVALVEMPFSYSLGMFTIFVQSITSLNQIVLFFISFAPRLAWVSRMYVPLFLRCWPMRQYALFILDSVALMMPRSRRMDLLRLATGPITLFLCMLFSAAGCFRVDQTFEGYPTNFIVAFYFIVVTVSTVGFGDVTPQTTIGRILSIVIIFVFISRMPTFIRVIRSTVKILKEFRPYKGRKKHFIVYGLVTREEAIAIADEVFCLYQMKSVCFCNNVFSSDVLAIERHPTYRLRCSFLIIDSLNALALRRMKASKAAALIIMPVREGYSSRVDDDVMLSSLIFSRLVPSLPQYIWLRYGLHAKLLKGHRAAVIDEHLKQNIMSTALLLPGIVPFLVNLVRTAWARGKEPDNLWTEECIDDWKNQYEYSRRNVLRSTVVPMWLVGSTLYTAIVVFKKGDVLVVGVAEHARKIMHLDVTYVLQEDDVLMTIYERSSHSLAHLLEAFSHMPNPADEEPHGAFGTPSPSIHRTGHSTGGEDDPFLLAHRSREDNARLAMPGHDASVPQMLGGITDASTGARTQPREMDAGKGNAVDIKRRLSLLEDVNQSPCNVPLQEVALSPAAVKKLKKLLKRRERAAAIDTPPDVLATFSKEIDAILEREAQTPFASLDCQMAPLAHSTCADEGIFLFVDQTASIRRKTKLSAYEDVISQTIAQYELYIMMQCICAVKPRSHLTLLTLRAYSPEFLQMWANTFGTPLRYIRGQGSLDSHLSYALRAESAMSRVQGILIYCSQMGPRDFGDVPIFSVENNVRDLLVWNERLQEGIEDLPEQNIMVELGSFKSCVSVAPFHSDAVWRRRGEDNFQDSLAFMMGRCFSPNMMQPLMIHSYRDACILQFIAMVLNLSSTAEMFDMGRWTNRTTQSQTLFKQHSNETHQFTTFGEAFHYLLSNVSYVTIGVFRLFSKSEMLSTPARYFITNPPLSMPLLTDDIVYCLDATAGNHLQGVSFSGSPLNM